MASHLVNKVAPTQMYNPQRDAKGHVDYTFTIGKLDAGMAILIGHRASLIEFPSLLLPPGVTHGSVVDIRVLRNEEQERQQREHFDALQTKILEQYGTKSPSPPVLRVRNVTQTTVTLEWDPLELASADLISLDIMRNGHRIAQLPNPMTNTTSKISGLEINTEYSLQLLLHTTAGSYASEILRTRTHTINDMSGIHVCFASVNSELLLEKSKEVLEALGGHASDKIQIDTTHVIATHEPEPKEAPTPEDERIQSIFAKANRLSIPVVQPHWLFACESEKRMINISGFYLDKIPANAGVVSDRLRGKADEEQAPPPPEKGEAAEPKGEEQAPQGQAPKEPEETDQTNAEPAEAPGEPEAAAPEPEAPADKPQEPKENTESSVQTLHATQTNEAGVENGMENIDLNDTQPNEPS